MKLLAKFNLIPGLVLGAGPGIAALVSGRLRQCRTICCKRSAAGGGTALPEAARDQRRNSRPGAQHQSRNQVELRQ